MTLPPLLRPSYWFAINPPPLLPSVDRALLVVFSLLLIAGLIVGLVTLRGGLEKLQRRMMKRAAGQLILLGAFGLLLYALTYERVTVFGMRFGYVVWAALFVWYAYKTYHYSMIEIPEMEARRAERERFSKWLPKAKT